MQQRKSHMHNAAYVTSLPVDSVVTKLEQLNLKYILMI